ncbi:TIR domain-containing protein [Sphaerotilus hippei]|uniref:TIR domain-containing protein n=1 Tax=Sphaerotilus hippei TaxID=744406 RepID=A0A318H3Y8_9BURK|nr:toll/interleukin-1 receptor domain-containing protein [Sphaerotilus hippei]PXW93660.1 TIR domain-containing protein [Sphaerotilus hippei]
MPRLSSAASAPPDLFISCAREDRPVAQALARALESQGLAVWWDREAAAGQDAAPVIAERLAAARMTCVLWSPDSVRSAFVRDECTRARDAGKLLPIRIADVEVPIGFGTLQTLDLLGWAGEPDGSTFPVVREEILRAVRNSHLWLDSVPLSSRVHPRRGAARSLARQAEDSLTVGFRRAAPLLTPLKLLRLLVLVGVLASVWGGYRFYQEHQAGRLLAAGLQAQFAVDPDLEAARDAYQDALRARPGFGAAHYLLAHVHAQSQRPNQAREQFLAALQDQESLTTGQRETAQRLLNTLDLGEAEALVAHRGAEAEAQALDARASLMTQATAVPPHLDRQHQARTLVDGLFDPDRQRHVDAASTLALTPGLNSDALLLALDLADRHWRTAPAAGSTHQGLVAVLGLARSASPVTLALQREGIERLLAQAGALGGEARTLAAALRQRLETLQPMPRPVAYVQIAHERQRPLALQFTADLSSAGYLVAPIELVDTARSPQTTEIRSQGSSHQGLARWLRRSTARLIEDDNVRLATLARAHPPGDTYELWLARDLCALGNEPAECAP